MTAKEKADEIVLKFRELPQEDTMMFYLAFEISKQCALIAVDEILKAVTTIADKKYDYWKEVKQEIQKL